MERKHTFAIDLDPEEVYKMYHEDGMTIDGIAKAKKVARRTVQKRLARYLEEHPTEKPSEIPFFEFDPLALTSPEELFNWYIIRKLDLETISYKLNLDISNVNRLLDLWNITDPMNWSNPHWWKAPEALYRVSPDPVKIERPDFSWMKIKKF